MIRGFLVITMVSAALLMPCALPAQDEAPLGDEGSGAAIQELTEETGADEGALLEIGYGGDRHGTVTRVFDAAFVEIDGEKMELVGVTGLARNSDGTARECYSQESAAYLESRVLGKKVSYSVEQLDGFEKDLGDKRIYLYEGGMMLNSELVRRGMAFADRRPSYPEEEYFMELQAGARRRHAGLWHSCPVECDRFGDCRTRNW